MKTFVAILFLLLFGIATNVKPSYYYYWKVNQKAITKEYCVNKEKPILACNGKCHLAKKINQSSEKQDKRNSEKSNLRIPTIEYISFSSSDFVFNDLIESKKTKHSIIFNEHKLLKGYLQRYLKPPILSV